MRQPSGTQLLINVHLLQTLPVTRRHIHNHDTLTSLRDGERKLLSKQVVVVSLLVAHGEGIHKETLWRSHQRVTWMKQVQGDHHKCLCQLTAFTEC